VEQHIGLVRLHLSRHVHPPACPTREREADDLFQEGVLALIDAAMRHVPARHGPFAAFAVPRIRFAIAQALHERFSTLHVPATVRRRVARQHSVAESAEAGPASNPPVLVSLGAYEVHLPAKAIPASEPVTPTIRQCLGQKYADAVRAAAAEWKRRRHRAGSAELADRIVTERLTVIEPEYRAPLRQIARDLHAASSTVARCEQFLVRGVACRLDGDRQYHVLREAARRAVDGLDAPIDARLRACLRDAYRQVRLEEFDGLDDQRKGVFLIRATRLAGKAPTRLADAMLRRLTEDQMRSITVTVSAPARSPHRPGHAAPRPPRREHDPSAPCRPDEPDDRADQRRREPRARADEAPVGRSSRRLERSDAAP